MSWTFKPKRSQPIRLFGFPSVLFLDCMVVLNYILVEDGIIRYEYADASAVFVLYIGDLIVIS